MKVFLDTNILMDWYQKDRPGNALAMAIISASGENTYNLVVSTQSIIDSAYSLRKTGVTYEAFADMLGILRSRVRIVGIDEIDLLWAMDHYSGDFEDDVLYARAQARACDAIVTNDRKFRKKYEGKDRRIRFFTPEELLAEMLTAQT